MVVCVLSVGCLMTRIDKLAYVNFHVAADNFVQNNFHVLNMTHLKCFAEATAMF